MKIIKVTTIFEERYLTSYMSARQSIRSVIKWTLKKNNTHLNSVHLYGAFPYRPGDGEELNQIPSEVMLKQYVAHMDKVSRQLAHRNNIFIMVRQKREGDEANLMKISNKSVQLNRPKEIMSRIGDFFSVTKSTRLDKAPNDKIIRKLFGSPLKSQNPANVFYDSPVLNKRGYPHHNFNGNFLHVDEDVSNDSMNHCVYDRTPCCKDKSLAIPFYHHPTRHHPHEFIHHTPCNHLSSHHHQNHHHHHRFKDELERAYAKENFNTPASTSRHKETGREVNCPRDLPTISSSCNNFSSIKLSMGVSQRILRLKQNENIPNQINNENSSKIVTNDFLPKYESTPLSTLNVREDKNQCAHDDSDESSIWISRDAPRLSVAGDLSSVNDISDAESVFHVTNASMEGEASMQSTPLVSKISRMEIQPFMVERKSFLVIRLSE